MLYIFAKNVIYMIIKEIKKVYIIVMDVEYVELEVRRNLIIVIYVISVLLLITKIVIFVKKINIIMNVQFV